MKQKKGKEKDEWEQQMGRLKSFLFTRPRIAEVSACKQFVWTAQALWNKAYSFVSKNAHGEIGVINQLKSVKNVLPKCRWHKVLFLCRLWLWDRRKSSILGWILDNLLYLSCFIYHRLFIYILANNLKSIEGTTCLLLVGFLGACSGARSTKVLSGIPACPGIQTKIVSLLSKISSQKNVENVHEKWTIAFAIAHWC